VSVLDDVLRHARAGATPGATARALGVDVGLVDAALDQWSRRGVVLPARSSGAAGSSCSTCPPPTAPLPLACAGCPLAPRRP